jgi:opacity protein-like surface antigen
MRKLVVATFAGTLAMGAPADAGGRSWYLGLEGGVELDGGGQSVGSGADSGWAGLVTIGAGITSHLSLEAELGYRSTSSDGFSADIDQLSVMANLVYEAPLSEVVTVAIGVGVGGDQVSLDYYSGFSKSEMEVAAQLKLGLSVDVSENTELIANYRYMESITSSPVDNSTLTVGVRFAL